VRGTWARKGFGASVRRAALIPVRYGLTAEKIRKQLQLMVETVRLADCSPTIGVTAATLVRHPRIFSDLAGLDLVVHGYEHVGYGGLTDEQQAHDLDRACFAFATLGLNANGFRAPYLDANGATLRLLRERGFAFDSSFPYLALPNQSEFRPLFMGAAQVRYGTLETTPQTPYLEANLVEVPVSLPDDELLIDALGYRNPELISRIFYSMLKEVVNRNSVLVLQIHPERFSLCAAATRDVLSRATDLGGWMTNLTELAAWIRGQNGSSGGWPDGHAFALAVTGDLDALTIADFGRRLWP